MKRKTLIYAATLMLLTMGNQAFASGLAVPPNVQINLFGYALEFSHGTVFMTALVSLGIFLFCFLLGRSFSKDNPGRLQIFIEIVISMFDDLVTQSIGKNRGRKYLPYIGTLFIFLWSSNMVGLFPIPHYELGGEQFQDYNANGQYDPGEPFVTTDDVNKNNVIDAGFPIPAMEEPTKNLNVTLGLALLFVVIIGHGSALYYQGIGGYVKEYFSPGGVMGVIMFPLNVVGKLAEVVSISFRLFGNIFGGAVILFVVCGLIHYLVLPVALFGFFVIFVGTVQAFVFTMLALTYIAMGGAAEE